MATVTSLSAFTNEELRAIFKPALQRLRTLLNNYEHWPQDDDWPQKVRRAVMGLVNICNKLPSTCPLYAGHSIKALFDLIRTKPQLRQAGAPLDPSFLQDVKKDPPAYLDSFDVNHPHAYIDETIQFVAQWRIPPHLPVLPTNQSAQPTAPKQSNFSNAKDDEKEIDSGKAGKGKEREKEGSCTVDDDINGEAGGEDNEGEDDGDDEQEQDELQEDVDGDAEHGPGAKGVPAIRRSPRKRVTPSVQPGEDSGSGAPFILCDRCLKAKALAQHSKALGKKFDKSNLDPPCTPPGGGSCPRCANGKKRCERVLNGDSIKALALALKRGRQPKSSVAADDLSAHSPQGNQEASTVKKSVKRKSAAYIEDSDVDNSTTAAAAADSENPPAAKKARTDFAKSKSAPDVEGSKAAAKAKPSTKRSGKASKATTPVEPVQVTAMGMGTSTAPTSIAGPSTLDFVYAGTKEYGPLYHPQNAQPMVLSNLPPIPAPTDSTVLPSYQTELATGSFAVDLVNCTSKQDALEGRMNQAESGIRGLSAAVGRLEVSSRTPTVPRGEFEELRRKVAVMEKDFNEREARLSKTTDSALALVRSVEERMKSYEARMEGIEERMNELSNKVDGVAKNSLDERVAQLSAKIDDAVRTSANASSKAGSLQEEVEKSRRDLRGLYAVEDDIRGLLGRMSDAEHELMVLADRCEGLEADSGEIWDRLTTSVNQSTLEAVLDRVGGNQRPSEARSFIDRATSPTTQPPCVMDRGTSPNPAPAPQNFMDRATSPIPDSFPPPTRLHIATAPFPARPFITAPFQRPIAVANTVQPLLPSASVGPPPLGRPSGLPPVISSAPPGAADPSKAPSPPEDVLAPDSPLSPPPDDLPQETTKAATRRKAAPPKADLEGAAGAGTRRSKRQKKT